MSARALGAKLRSETTLHIWLFVGAMTAGAIALYVTTLAGQPEIASPSLPWWGLAAAFLLSEAFPVHLHFRSETHTLSLSELAMVFGLFFMTPGALLLAVVLGSGVAFVCVRRQRTLKFAFNIAQFSFSVAVSIVVFRSALTLGAALGPAAWAAAIAAAATFGILSVTLVATTIALATGSAPLNGLPKTIGLALGGSIASGALAVIAVELLHSDTRSAWLLAVPVLCWGLAFRAYGAQRRRHEHLEFLFETMRATQGAPELRAAVRELLVAARAMLSAEYAEIVLLGATPEEGALRSILTPTDERLLEPDLVSEFVVEAARETSEHDAAVLLARGRKPHPLDGYLAERGLTDALLTSLRRDGAPFALLVVGNRAGEVSTFSGDDRKLFETFAGHASVLLENDQVKEQLRHQAYHDALTGLPNRSLFTERVAQAHATNSDRFAVLFVDLDDFKTINDTFGHSAGDELLVAVAERIRACVRPEDVAARLGGDEFAILLGFGADDAPEQVALRVVAALQTPFLLAGRDVYVHASIGIATGLMDARTADDVLTNADLAMYNAKASGKSKFSVYEPRMHARVRRRHELAAALEHVVERGEIVVCYQPIVALSSARTVAFEALVRWQHPTRGLIAPDRFLPLAEERGLMVDIGRAVLREATMRACQWQTTFTDQTELAISVNLSPSELQHPQLTAQVASILADTGLPPESLILEITETGAMSDPAATSVTLRDLRRLGVRLALDDFGTGYSSLSHLRDFPLDILKIAKPFVDRLNQGHEDATFIDAILRLAAALDLSVVAEGIEHAQQANTLRQLECSLGQGFYFDRPLNAADAERRLAGAAPPATRIRAA